MFGFATCCHNSYNVFRCQYISCRICNRLCNKVRHQGLNRLQFCQTTVQGYGRVARSQTCFTPLHFYLPVPSQEPVVGYAFFRPFIVAFGWYHILYVIFLFKWITAFRTVWIIFFVKGVKAFRTVWIIYLC